MIHPDIYRLHDGVWSGPCAHCGQLLTMDDIRADRVILAGSLSHGFEACHVQHVIDAYHARKPGAPLPEVVEKFAHALSGRLAGGGAHAPS